MTELVCFAVTLEGEYERLYNELLMNNDPEMVHQKLVEAGFHKLAEMQLTGQL